MPRAKSPRQHVLAIIREMRQLTNAVRKTWDVPTTTITSDGAWGPKAPGAMPGDSAAHWSQLHQHALALEGLAAQLTERSWREYHAALERDQS